jgi:hypothetical protein
MHVISCVFVNNSHRLPLGKLVGKLSNNVMNIAFIKNQSQFAAQQFAINSAVNPGK